MTTGAGTTEPIQPRSSAVYKVRPGPNAVTTAGRPARGRPQERSASRTSRTVVDEQLPCVGQHRPRRVDGRRPAGRAARPPCRGCGVLRGARPSASTSSTVYACRLQQRGDVSTDVAGEHVGDLGRQAHAEAEVGDVPRHVVGGAGVGERRDVEHLEAAARGVRWVRGEHDGRGRVAEERVRHHLAAVVGRGLDVQRRQLAAQQHGRPTAADDVVGDGAQAGDRGVAAHVPDEDPLQVGSHAEVGRDADVEAGRGVAGAGGHGEQADVLGGEPGVGQRRGDRVLAER